MRIADVQFTAEDGVVHARFVGEIDMSNADDLGAALTDATTNEMLGVVMDLTEVDYMDSAAIHLVYRMRARLRARCQDLRLVIPENSRINDALRLAGVDRHLEVVRTVEDATRELRS
jgi:anti-anti-sigma factor